MDALIIGLQLGIVIACLLVGTKYGGMGLGLISGFGLLILVFVFQLKPVILRWT